MMHRQQRQSSSFLRLSKGSCKSSIGRSSCSSGSNNNNNNSIPSNDYPCPLSIVTRRCSSIRTRASSSTSSAFAPSLKCFSTSATSTSSSPVLLSVLAWSVTLLLISSCLGIADAGILMGHPLGKRSFMQLQCKGIYDKSIFARLDRICEDCYNLFREPQLHTLCRYYHVSSNYFFLFKSKLIHSKSPIYD